jgi:dUTP pyrophosphatase
MTLKIKVRTNFRYLDNRLPETKHPGDSGMDLRADLEAPLTLWPGKAIRVPTGLWLQLPEGDDEANWDMQIRSRSGLAAQGIIVANSPGTVDSSYRGEIQVLLFNLGDQRFVVKPGDRVAQVVVSLCAKFKWQVVEDLDDTSRNHQGFGSTGIE